MSLRVIGAGVGRTATMSLKLGLETLLGEPCYHMGEVFAHPDHIPVWHAAAKGQMPDWRDLFRGFAAAVDWPAAAFWPELIEAFPDAPVLLSVRDAEAWWKSAHNSIFPVTLAADDEWGRMCDDLLSARFTAALDDREACIAAFNEHNARVRAGVPADRLIEWRPGDGWAPICRALDVAIPDEPFPHTNKSQDWGG
jgi:hypothetical protein